MRQAIQKFGSNGGAQAIYAFYAISSGEISMLSVQKGIETARYIEKAHPQHTYRR